MSMLWSRRVYFGCLAMTTLLLVGGSVLDAFNGEITSFVLYAIAFLFVLLPSWMTLLEEP